MLTRKKKKIEKAAGGLKKRIPDRMPSVNKKQSYRCCLKGLIGVAWCAVTLRRWPCNFS